MKRSRTGLCSARNTIAPRFTQTARRPLWVGSAERVLLGWWIPLS